MSFSMWQKLSERMMAKVVVSAPEAGAAVERVGALLVLMTLSLTMSGTPDGNEKVL